MCCLASSAAAQQYAFFYDPGYVDTTREAPNLLASITGLGYTANTFTGTSEAEFTAALTGATGLVIPELENGDLYAALDAPTVAMIGDFVRDGGLLLITDSAGNASALINGVFGTSIVSDDPMGETFLHDLDAQGTSFEGGLVMLPDSDAVDGLRINTLPAEALAIYQPGIWVEPEGPATSVMILPQEDGNVVFLGFGWYEEPTPGAWETTLDKGILPFGNIWIGNTSTSWAEGTNWAGDFAPTTGDVAIFAGTEHPYVVHDQPAGTVYAGIRFNSNCGSFGISGNALGIADGAIINESPNGATFSMPVSVSGDVTFDAGPGSLAFDNTVTLNAGSTLTVAGDPGIVAINGDINGGGALVVAGWGGYWLRGTNSYTGGTTVSDGTLTGTTSSLQNDIVNDAYVIFEQDTDGTYAGDMSGSGFVRKQGTGTVGFSGTNTYTGGTTVTAGRLNINGYSASGAYVSANGTLGGTGTIAGTVLNGGTVAPGNSIGTLSVQNDFTNSTVGSLEVEINDGGNTPGTNVDLLVVTSGGGATAEIQGGTVNVVVTPGTYSSGTQYTFLTADSVDGTFDSITDNLADFHCELGYTATTVYFILQGDATDYASWGCTPNTVATGAYLDSVSAGATGNLRTLLDDLDAVPNADRCRSLAQLNGAIYGSLAEVGLQNSTVYLQSLAGRLRGRVTDGDAVMAGSPVVGAPVAVAGSGPDEPFVVRGQNCCCCERWATWATGFGLGGDAQSDGNAPGLDYSLGGVLFGAERMLGGHLLGFYGGYLGNYVATDVADSAKINGVAYGTYVARHDGCHYYILLGGLEFDDYESTRPVQFGGLTARGDFDGWKGMAYVERGLTLGGPCLRVQPLAALQYIYLRENRFSEHGGGAANLDVAGIDAHSLRSALGARAEGRGWMRRGRRISPEVRAMWIHEYLETDTALNARFNPVGGAMFAVDGLDLGRDWALAGGGFNWQLGGGWEAYADYDAFVNDRQTMHVGSGGISHVW